MEYLHTSSPETLSPSITEETTRLLGDLGLVWAEVTLQTAEHPEDEKWVIRSNN